MQSKLFKSALPTESGFWLALELESIISLTHSLPLALVWQQPEGGSVDGANCSQWLANNDVVAAIALQYGSTLC